MTMDTRRSNVYAAGFIQGMYDLLFPIGHSVIFQAFLKWNLKMPLRNSLENNFTKSSNFSLPYGSILSENINLTNTLQISKCHFREDYNSGNL